MKQPPLFIFLPMKTVTIILFTLSSQLTPLHLLSNSLYNYLISESLYDTINLKFYNTLPQYRTKFFTSNLKHIV
jgi:hypothetical protein